MSFPSPLLHIPTRTTEEVDFSEPLSDYIVSAFEQDATKFRHEIAVLNRLRQDIRGAGKDVTGRDLLYRYYGQLELLDLRFPFDENHVKICFMWRDSFTGVECSQYSAAFEKASVIYNLGATCSSIAALQNRFEAEGLRMAFNYFQAAAGLFSFINENFLHAPSVDMSRDSINTLTELSLAQAQECFLEKVTVVEKKKGNLASKLCAQLAFMYANVLDGFSLESISGQFDKTWLELIKIKSKLFLALAHYHRHLQYETDNQYGLCVSHCMIAESNIKEAHKLAEKFAYNFPNFTIATQSNDTATTGKNPSSASTALLEMTGINLKMIGDKLVSSVKDNDMIYHDTIPPVQSLAPLEKLNAVKVIHFADLLPNGQADIPKIVGPDIFTKLIPMSVHESSSVYSEEKSKLYRNQQKIAKQADDEIDATINSLELLNTMEKIKSIINDPRIISGDILPVDVINWSVFVQENEMKSSKYLTDDLLQFINALKPEIAQIIYEIPVILEKEQLDCENMRVKYMEKWAQEPSASLTTVIRNELKSHRDSYEKAILLDSPIISDLKESGNIIKVLNNPIEKVEAYLVECITSSVPYKNDGSLLDDNGSNDSGKIGVLGEKISIEKIDALLQHLRSLKKDRVSILEEIKEKIKKDDISSLLLLNKNKEKQIFQSELTKYATLQTKLSSNIDSHKQFLNDLVSEFKRLVETSEALRVIEARNREKSRILMDWKGQYDRYKKAKDGLRRGRVFYTDLKSSLEDLKSKVVKYVNQRNAERIALEKKIEADFAEHGQQAIQEQLRQLSIDSAVNDPYQYSNVTPGATTYQAARLSPNNDGSSKFKSDTYVSSQPLHNSRQPIAPVVSPQSSIPVSPGSLLPDGSRTPIPVTKNSWNNFQRETSLSGLGIHQRPGAITLDNHQSAVFDERQYSSMETRDQSKPFNRAAEIRHQAPYAVVSDPRFISPEATHTSSSISANISYPSAQNYHIDNPTPGVNPSSTVSSYGYGHAPQMPGAVESHVNTRLPSNAPLDYSYPSHPPTTKQYSQGYYHQQPDLSQNPGYPGRPEAQNPYFAARSSYTPSQPTLYGQINPNAPSFPRYPENSQMPSQFSGYPLSNPSNQYPRPLQSGHGYGYPAGNTQAPYLNSAPRPTAYGSDLGYRPPSQVGAHMPPSHVGGYGPMPLNPNVLSQSYPRPPPTSSYLQQRPAHPGYNNTMGEYGRPRMPNIQSQNASFRPQQGGYSPNNGGSLLD